MDNFTSYYTNVVCYSVSFSLIFSVIVIKIFSFWLIFDVIRHYKYDVYALARFVLLINFVPLGELIYFFRFSPNGVLFFEKYIKGRKRTLILLGISYLLLIFLCIFKG